MFLEGLSSGVFHWELQRCSDSVHRRPALHRSSFYLYGKNVVLLLWLEILVKELCSDVVTMFFWRTSSTSRRSWTETWGRISWSSSQIMWQRNTSTRYCVSKNPLIVTDVSLACGSDLCDIYFIFWFFISTSSKRSFHAISSQTINDGECDERSSQPPAGWDLLKVSYVFIFFAMFCMTLCFCPQIGFLWHRLCFLDSFLRSILLLLNLSSRSTLLKTKSFSWSCRRTVSAGNAVLREPVDKETRSLKPDFSSICFLFPEAISHGRERARSRDTRIWIKPSESPSVC